MPCAHPLWISHSARGVATGQLSPMQNRHCIFLLHFGSLKNRGRLPWGNIMCVCLDSPLLSLQGSWHRAGPSPTIVPSASRYDLYHLSTHHPYIESTLPISSPSPSLPLTQSYWPGSGWLVTRSPSHSSVSRFWRTVVNKKCSIIIDFSSKNKVQPSPTWSIITNMYAVHTC